MNLKVIIHALILLFILHIILINIDYSVTIGKKIENFDNHPKIYDKTEPKQPSMDFLQISEKDQEFIKKMNEFSQEDPKESTFDKKNEFPVIPANGVLSNENSPNFESNVADTFKFYNINHDNLKETELKATSIQALNQKATNVINETQKIDNQVRQAHEKPTTWEYNDEFAMNGGKMGEIVGFDGIESQYADFGSILSPKDSSDQKNPDNIPHDDLRKPVVYYP
jgi:hypothetical protein